MKVSFRYAYESLLNLKKKEKNKVAILFSVNINRVKQLVDLFSSHSNFAISKISFSELTQQISRVGKTLEKDAKRKAIRYMKKTIQSTSFLKTMALSQRSSLFWMSSLKS